MLLQEDRSQMVSVLLAHAHEDEPPLGRKLALIWMDEFIRYVFLYLSSLHCRRIILQLLPSLTYYLMLFRIYKDKMLPYLSSYLTAVLPSLDCDTLKGELIKIARQIVFSPLTLKRFLLFDLLAAEWAWCDHFSITLLISVVLVVPALFQVSCTI